jgi:hypothetical protein
MNVRLLIVAAILLILAVILGIMGGGTGTADVLWAQARDWFGGTVAGHPAKSHKRKPVAPRNATATIKNINHDWGFVVLSLERGHFAQGNVGYVERRGENGGLLWVESVSEREAVANIESVESKELKVGDFVVFSPDLVQVSNFNIDFGLVEWVSE